MVLVRVCNELCITKIFRCTYRHTVEYRQPQGFFTIHVPCVSRLDRRARELTYNVVIAIYMYMKHQKNTELRTTDSQCMVKTQ